MKFFLYEITKYHTSDQSTQVTVLINDASANYAAHIQSPVPGTFKFSANVQARYIVTLILTRYMRTISSSCVAD